VICSLLLLGMVFMVLSSYALINRGDAEIEAYREAIMAEKKAMLTALVGTATTIAQHNYEESLKSPDSTADLKARTLSTINALRYGKDGTDYFYTMDTVSRTMLQHPKESLVGKPDTFFKDPDDKLLIVSQMDIALNKGEGFDTYKWPKLGEKEPQPKLAYVKYFKEWNMAMTSGIYIDDIDKVIAAKQAQINGAIRAQIYWQGGVLVAVLLLSIALAYLIVSIGIVRPIRKIIAMLKDIAKGEGDLTKRIVDNSGDETEEMANWFNQFVEKVQNIIKDVAGK